MVSEGEEGERREEGKVSRRATGHSKMPDTGWKMWGMVTVGCQERDRFFLAHTACSLACPPPHGRVGGWRGGGGEGAGRGMELSAPTGRERDYTTAFSLMSPFQVVLWPV